ncbi:SPOR domain-containing protein [Orrella sp. 11846]|uniref:SPOR domain-containing protein n=1 Tax=Orrella sp. 11846 TaxID=3409913 RepID=UPI003B5C3371
MGLFSRKPSSKTPDRPRPSVSSEAQANAMRVRARRRLTGAIALVLAAVIVLPMLLDSEPKPVSPTVKITVPSRDAPFKPDFKPIDAQTATDVAATETDASLKPVDELTQGEKVAEIQPDASATKADAVKPVETVAEKPADKPAKVDEKPTTPAAKPIERTDDGSAALALLGGRTPSSGASAPQSKSGLVVQVAAYSTQNDAQAMRNKLRGEGVSNAFVEQATVNGKTTFRLRVGPFDSRDAAQAAQTRLRTLGYPNGFIATQ